MTIFVTAALLWVSLLFVVFCGRLHPSIEKWSRTIAFRPTETISPEQLFRCLLSGNFALLMRDNFNQLASALSPRRIHRILYEHWAIDTQEDCLRVIQSRIEALGRMTPAEKRAIAAWLLREQVDSNEYAALADTCLFMALRAHITQVDELRHDHLSVLAWDIQQLAYLVRLAFTVGYVPRRRAEDLLQMLAARARSHYGSWKDYSLAALVGLGMRGSLEIFDHAEWSQFARTHSVFIDPHRSPVRSASTWGQAADAAPSLRQRPGGFTACPQLGGSQVVAS